MHKKHIKFSDKCFDLAKNLKNTGVDEFSLEQDEISKFNEKLKKIELSPASFLEDEKRMREDKGQIREFELMFSPIPKLNDSNNRYTPEPFLGSSSKKTSKTCKVFENPNDIYPLNISQHPLKEEKYDKTFDDFYDRNINKFTVTSQNNEISDPFQKFSQTHTHLNKETVNLSKPTKKTQYFINKKQDVLSGTFIYEEQNRISQKKPVVHDEKYQKKHVIHDDQSDVPKKLGETYVNDPMMGPHKRSISALPLQKDGEMTDDLREIFASAYMISLESLKEFQSIPKFTEIPKFNELQKINEIQKFNEIPKFNDSPKNEKKHYPLYKFKNPNLSKSQHENPKLEKRNYLIYSVDDPNHLKHKKEHIIDCLVYDLDQGKRGENEYDFNKKNRKKIFDPM